MATIGDNTVQCGPQDIVCNGPLVSDAQYGVRYALFSGNQSQEYPFFEEAQFTTGESEITREQANSYNWYFDGQICNVCYGDTWRTCTNFLFMIVLVFLLQ